MNLLFTLIYFLYILYAYIGLYAWATTNQDFVEFVFVMLKETTGLVQAVSNVSQTEQRPHIHWYSAHVLQRNIDLLQ